MLRLPLFQLPGAGETQRKGDDRRRRRRSLSLHQSRPIEVTHSPEAFGSGIINWGIVLFPSRRSVTLKSAEES